MIKSEQIIDNDKKLLIMIKILLIDNNKKFTDNEKFLLIMIKGFW